jgi:hypothetical protein
MKTGRYRFPKILFELRAAILELTVRKNVWVFINREDLYEKTLYG